MTRAFSLFSNHKRTFFALAFLCAFSLTIVYAAPRTESYAPGDTLDPDCAPGEDFCSVEIATGGTSSPITIENTNSLFSTGLTGTGVGSDAQHAIFLGEGAGNGATDAFNANFLGYLAGQDATNAHDSNFLGANTGNGAIDSSDSNFFGNSAGANATNASYSNFFGNSAGANAINASGSNFFGANAGQGAEDASNSNFFGNNTATGASNAQHSNFFGTEAGGAAINASHSNFFGSNTGNNAINAQYSNFFGTSAGEGAEDASNSNFFGQNTGKGAVNTSYSNLFGYNVGYNPGSNNIGSNNIIIGTNISLPNATANAINIGGVLFGTGTYSTTTGNPSITAVSGGRIGIGVVTPSATLDVAGEIKGTNLTITGDDSTVNAPTNLSATQTQVCSSGCNYVAESYEHNYRIYSYKTVGSGRIYSSSYVTLPSNLMDDGSLNVYDITVTWTAAAGADGYRVLKYDTFYGYTYSGGFDTTSTSFIDDGCTTVCFNGSSVITSNISYGNIATINGVLTLSGPLLMQGATLAADTSNNFSIGTNNTLIGTNNFFVGNNAGSGITSNVTDSNFFGSGAGAGATNALVSNFFGSGAGAAATDANSSNFFGYRAGADAYSANESNFLGNESGSGASNAGGSNFFGTRAGNGASNASNSNFLGVYSGSNASNASYSNLFGYQAGRTFISNNIGSNNIIIGTNISLPNATANAINLGGVLFGTGTYSNTGGNPSITAVSGGRIGIGVVSPSYTLQVGNSGVSGIVARFENSAGTCDINPTSASLSCSSDETLKKDIVAVPDDMLEKILSLQPVTYHWNSEDDTDTTHIGFIAQQVEEVFPDLVTTDRQTGLKSLNYTGLIPYTVKAVQEMNIQIKTIADIDTPNSLRESLVAWLGSVANGIENIFSTKITTKEFCVQDDTGETCLTRSQIDSLLGGQQSNGGSSTDEPVPDPIVETPVDDQTLPEEISPEPEPETPAEEPVVDEPAPEITTPAE